MCFVFVYFKVTITLEIEGGLDSIDMFCLIQ